MGMFDSVYFKCDCGANVEFQSKAGECRGRSYFTEDEPVPVEIAKSIEEDFETCPECGEGIQATISNPLSDVYMIARTLPF